MARLPIRFEPQRDLRDLTRQRVQLIQDKTRVANYAQWRSKADVDAMMANSEARAHMVQAAKIATSFDPIYYDLRETHGPA